MQVDKADGGADFELCDHIISFLNAALTSPEAQANLPLRKRFINALLDKGVPYAPAPSIALVPCTCNSNIVMICQSHGRCSAARTKLAFS